MIKTHTLYILIAIIVLNLSVIFGCVYFYNSIGKVTASIAKLRNEISTSEEQGNRLGFVSKLLLDTELERKEAESFIIESGSEVAFIKSIEKIAKDQGLAVKTSGVSVSDLATSSEKYEDLRVEIETTGSWQKNLAFLSLLESLPVNSIVSRASFKLDENLSEPVKNRPKQTFWKGSFEVVAVKRK